VHQIIYHGAHSVWSWDLTTVCLFYSTEAQDTGVQELDPVRLMTMTMTMQSKQYWLWCCLHRFGVGWSSVGGRVHRVILSSSRVEHTVTDCGAGFGLFKEGLLAFSEDDVAALFER
jgi:hypothetical protein